MYPENTICLLKKDNILKDTHPKLIDEFKENTQYRVSFDDDQKGCIVYGHWMAIEDYEANFFDYIKFMQAKLALTNTGKPISLNAFKKRLEAHGNRHNRYYIVGYPKENMFGFYPAISGTKQDELKQCYQMYLNLIKGEMDDVDDRLVQWGNCGIPLSYGNLRKII